jgi:uncharacterized protein with FMN-binding domain
VKRALVIILAVAILGALGLYTKKHDSKVGLAPIGTTYQPSTTTSTNTSNSSTPVSVSSASYKDGRYTGGTANTPYGNVQVAVTINSGKIINVDFLQMPSDRGHSQEVTSFSEPLLKQTTLQKRAARDIDFVSGATSTSYGYQQSLQAALDKASGVSFGQSTTS